jgi:hypothetical protein
VIIDPTWQAVQDKGGIVTGNYNFIDPYDARVGVLLCPDIDWHCVDKYQSSFFVNVCSSLCTLTTQGDQAVFHLFRNSTLFRNDHFTPTALQMEGACTSIILNTPAEEVLRFHYKHSVIHSWGGMSFASLLRTFQTAGVDLVAWSTNSDDQLSESYLDDWF